MNVIARLEIALDRELAKPKDEQREHLLRKWRAELSLYTDRSQWNGRGD